MPELSKAALRRLIRERKRRFTPEDLLAASAGPITRLEACPEFQSAQTVLLYHSLPDEVDTHALLARWWGRKRLLLPVVDGDDLRLVEYAGPDSLVAGVFFALTSSACPTCRSTLTTCRLMPLYEVAGTDGGGGALLAGRNLFCQTCRFSHWLCKVPDASSVASIPPDGAR